MDFLDIMDFVAYDIEKAHRIIEEAKSRMKAEEKKKEQADSGIETVVIVLI